MLEKKYVVFKGNLDNKYRLHLCFLLFSVSLVINISVTSVASFAFAVEIGNMENLLFRKYELYLYDYAGKYETSGSWKSRSLGYRWIGSNFHQVLLCG